MMKTVLVSAAIAAALGLATPAVANAGNNEQDFLAAAQTAGVVGVPPAILANGYNVCWQVWHGGSGDGAAAAIRQAYPTVTPEQAARFVNAASQNLCPGPGSYDWWAYGTGG